jgi:hypothetical protein
MVLWVHGSAVKKTKQTLAKNGSAEAGLLNI